MVCVCVFCFVALLPSSSVRFLITQRRLHVFVLQFYVCVLQASPSMHNRCVCSWSLGSTHERQILHCEINTSHQTHCRFCTAHIPSNTHTQHKLLNTHTRTFEHTHTPWNTDVCVMFRCKDPHRALQLSTNSLHPERRNGRGKRKRTSHAGGRSGSVR